MRSCPDTGRRPGRTDFLSISFSQADRVGHSYGPLSREQMDTLLRLDQLLKDLFSFLDEWVGPGRWVVGLTGDHGVMTMPERAEGSGLRLTLEERASLEEGLSGVAREFAGQGEGALAESLAGALREFPFVGPAYTHRRLVTGVPGDSLATLFQRNYTPGRSGGLLSQYGVEMWWAENVLDWNYGVRGTTHGSPFHYDRWVPLILMGPGIEAGRADVPVQPLDLAPTLAGLAGIPYPDDLDGVPLPLERD